VLQPFRMPEVTQIILSRIVINARFNYTILVQTGGAVQT